ncbi:bacterio-opsin activator domain-containing protein [Halohasta litorea]|uniref:Bacterio-opsin activator domain-containing protein n=1 Tax=Halohasta litorea TaxID=869891 RepID=A0ABD6D374_9EURY|nr:bacterio-opsin activator domain-containing protein [Halohasta litorea]MEA1930670.1 bacterio-opsin activator domain-containing protein [Euryarchaeota archaeon]
MIEVEFSISDSKYPFVAATQDGDCMIELAKMVPRADAKYAEFFKISGIRSDKILDLAGSYETLEVFVLQEYEDGGLFEFVASGDCPAYTLAELGALPREVIAVDGNGRIVAEIPQHYDSSAIINQFLDENSDAQLVSKQQQDSISSIFTRSAFQQMLQSDLTDRQLEVLRAAYNAGYYDWPRQASGKGVAEDLGITSATFSEHIHAAERKLLTILFSDSCEEQIEMN